MPLTYNPVVKNGLFECTYRGVTRKYRAIDVAEARWKMLKFFNQTDIYNTRAKLITVKVLEPTKRQFD